MQSYKINPFGTFVESHLFAEASEYAVFHRLTGELVQLQPAVRNLLQAAKLGAAISVSHEQLVQLGDAGREILTLIEKELLIQPDRDLLASFLDYFVIRPLQNPALTYKSETGEVRLVSISMIERVYSPKRGKLPEIIEEQLPPLATMVLLAADGTKTLREIYGTLGRANQSLMSDQEFTDTIELLTLAERQLIKLAPSREVLTQPFHAANLVPRNFYHASKWPGYDDAESIADFHVKGIEDPAWEFDVIEPTVNHSLRFPNALLSGLDYGTCFCDAVFKRSPPAIQRGTLKVLEVGGGTGSFARSFIQRAKSTIGSLSYHIMDLSPALAEKQRQTLGDVEVPVGYLSQDAIEFHLPGRKFDLIVSNEVIADFPVAAVERFPAGNGTEWKGDGASYVEKYSLSVNDAPDRFYVNAGVLRFLERAWSHLNPGGVLILSEYGSESRYPAESFHLNHSEFSIHFGHVTECARRIGFNCRLDTLKEFLGIDDRTPVLNGREEHVRCLNHVFEKHGKSVPFALFSETDFKAHFSDLARHLRLEPIRFLPLRSNFHYGPDIRDFRVLIMSRPALS